MAQSKRPKPRIILFDANHLNIATNPANPPPPASTILLAARQQTKAAWEAFEAAENALVMTDEEVHAEVLNYISSLRPRCATNPETEAEKARLTSRIHVPRIETTEACCQELEINAQALENATFKKPVTMEAQATMEIDLVVIRSCLATTREIVRTAQIQLDQARRTLNSS
jgi:hypothetical protein